MEDGGVAQGWRGNRDSGREKATRVDFMLHLLQTSALTYA